MVALVVQVRCVVVVVLDRRVTMRVGVFGDEWRRVRVVVVPVVVAVCVLVLERWVSVPVSVVFGDVKDDTRTKERSRHHRSGSEGLVAERPGERGAEDRVVFGEAARERVVECPGRRRTCDRQGA